MSSDDTPRMKEVSHTPPEGDSVTNVWQRGQATERTRETTTADD
jgi:hypothetical protein